MVTVSINRVNMAVRTGRRAVERSPQLSEGIPSLGRLPSKFFSGKRGLGWGERFPMDPFPRSWWEVCFPQPRGFSAIWETRDPLFPCCRGKSVLARQGRIPQEDGFQERRNPENA